MARQPHDTRSQQSQQSQQPQQSGAGAGMQGAGDTATASGTEGSGTSMQGGGQQPDQERQRQVSREPGAASGAGVQRGGARQAGAGTALAGAGQGQLSLLPAFMANPGLMASAFMSNPFAFAQAMSQEMDRIFSSFGMSDVGGALGSAAAGTPASRGLASTGGQQGLQRGTGRGRGGLAEWMPPMEVLQRGGELVVRADLPGLGPDDVDVEIEDGVLTVSGERRQERDERQEGFYRSERSYGAFSRSIALPEGVDEEQVHARFENGVLEVTIPMPQPRQRGRRVQVQAGASGMSPRQVSGQGGQRTGAESTAEGSST